MVASAVAIVLVTLAPLVTATHPAQQDSGALTRAVMSAGAKQQQQFWRCNEAPVAACAGPELSFETTDFTGDRCPAALRVHRDGQLRWRACYGPCVPKHGLQQHSAEVRALRARAAHGPAQSMRQARARAHL
jgi:hypothetical protein